jgi:hypothetical protein
MASNLASAGADANVIMTQGGWKTHEAMSGYTMSRRSNVPGFLGEDESLIDMTLMDKIAVWSLVAAAVAAVASVVMLIRSWNAASTKDLKRVEDNTADICLHPYYSSDVPFLLRRSIAVWRYPGIELRTGIWRVALSRLHLSNSS